MFARVATVCAEQAPFDGAFVAHALSDLHAEVVDELRAAEGRLRARNRALAEVARRDSLTGIANRATLDDLLATEVRRAQRYGHALSVLFIDVDHFKRVNDVRGHAAGDHVLRRLAATLGASLRPGDVVGRYGGEEFVIGLVNADSRAALRAAGRLRHDVARMRIDDGGETIRLTVSIGVAAMRAGQMSSPRELVERADRAMLNAKANGRNGVCGAEPASDLSR